MIAKRLWLTCLVAALMLNATGTLGLAAETTATTLESGQQVAEVGDPVTFTVRVHTAFGTPEGGTISLWIKDPDETEFHFHDSMPWELEQDDPPEMVFVVVFDSPGTYQLYAEYTDDSGTYASSRSVTIDQLIIEEGEVGPSADPTTTTLVSQQNPSTTGDEVTFTVTVSNTSTVAEGTVSLFVNDAVIKINDVLGEPINFKHTFTSAGNYQVHAVYNGTTSFAPTRSNDVVQVVADPVPTTLTLAPETETNDVGTSHTVTATVEDQDGDPLAGVTVRFSVSGAHTTSGSDVTDDDGQATFTYTGTSPGTDTIDAYADTNEDNVQDPLEPGSAASKLWVLPVDLLTDKEQCKKGGWMAFGVFANQGDCVAFVATKGRNQPGLGPDGSARPTIVVLPGIGEVSLVSSITAEQILSLVPTTTLPEPAQKPAEEKPSQKVTPVEPTNEPFVETIDNVSDETALIEITREEQTTAVEPTGGTVAVELPATPTEETATVEQLATPAEPAEELSASIATEPATPEPASNGQKTRAHGVEGAPGQQKKER